MEPITLEEVLSELAKLETDSPEGFTVREFATSINNCTDTAREKLRTLIEAGRVKFAGKQKRTNMVGHSTKIPVYKLVKDK